MKRYRVHSATDNRTEWMGVHSSHPSHESQFSRLKQPECLKILKGIPELKHFAPVSDGVFLTALLALVANSIAMATGPGPRAWVGPNQRDVFETCFFENHWGSHFLFVNVY